MPQANFSGIQSKVDERVAGHPPKAFASPTPLVFPAPPGQFFLICNPSFKQSYRKLPSDGLVGYREANRIYIYMCIYIYIYKYIYALIYIPHT